MIDLLKSMPDDDNLSEQIRVSATELMHAYIHLISFDPK